MVNKDKRFKPYKRIGLSEMRPYTMGEDLTGISVSTEDNPEKDKGMIARNPKNHRDQWYVNFNYWNENFVSAIDSRYFFGFDFYEDVYMIPIEKKDYWMDLKVEHLTGIRIGEDELAIAEQNIEDEFGEYKITGNIENITFENPVKV